VVRFDRLAGGSKRLEAEAVIVREECADIGPEDIQRDAALAMEKGTAVNTLWPGLKLQESRCAGADD
jgi:hypothetical protein